MFSILAPLRALAVAIVGLLLAWTWFRGGWWIALGMSIVVVSLILGVVLDRLGRAQLPKHPVAAVELMEWWLLTPATIAAIAGAVVIILAVTLALPDSASADTKELVGALGTGLTAFVTGVFISWAAKDDYSGLADHIRDAFFAKYKLLFPSESKGELLVYSNMQIDGWGRAARRKRAKAIAEELRNAAL